MKFIIISLVLFIFSISSQASEKIGKREVLLDNSDVEVVRLTYPVGTESGMHTHTPVSYTHLTLPTIYSV